MQRLRFLASLMVVVSGGASLASEFGLPRRPAAPTDESVARKRRRPWVVSMFFPPHHAPVARGCSLPPGGGGLGWGVVPRGTDVPPLATPDPSPQGGGEKKRRRAMI